MKRGNAPLAGGGFVEKAQRDANLCGAGGASTGFSQWGSFGGHTLQRPDGLLHHSITRTNGLVSADRSKGLRAFLPKLPES